MSGGPFWVSRARRVHPSEKPTWERISGPHADYREAERARDVAMQAPRPAYTVYDFGIDEDKTPEEKERRDRMASVFGASSDKAARERNERAYGDTAKPWRDE